MRLLFLGRLAPEKGVLDLIEALRYASGVTLRIVGDGPSRANAEKRAAGLHVEFLGFQPQPEVFFREADLLVAPSRSEGFSLVLLESMAAHLPALVSDLPAHCELSEDGCGATLFRCGDVADLLEKILLLRDHPEVRQRTAAAGAEIVGRRFTAESARSRHLQAFGIQ